jgi:hypothetical protein
MAVQELTIPEFFVYYYFKTERFFRNFQNKLQIYIQCLNVVNFEH